MSECLRPHRALTLLLQGIVANGREKTREAMVKLSIKAEEALTYRSGERTSAGTLTCTNCGYTREFSQTSVIQPCPSCHNTTFRKSH